MDAGNRIGAELDLDATRRTHLANERTYLAWLRTGLTAVAVGLAVAKLLPDLAGAGTTWPYASLGIGFCVLGIIMMAVGIRRVREVGRALERGEFRPMDDVAAVWVGILTITLAVATIAIVLFGP